MQFKEAPEVFKTQKSVAEYVCSRFKRKDGHPLAERTVRGHMQGRGKKGKLLYPRPEGGYSLQDVRDYVGRQGYIPHEADGMAREKVASNKQLEFDLKEKQRKLEKLTLEVQTKEFELQEKRKQFIRRDDLEAELVARGVALRYFLHQQFAERCEELAAKESAGLVDAAMDCVDSALHDYVSTSGWHVLVIG